MSTVTSPPRPLSQNTRRIAIIARRLVAPSIVDAALRDREPGGLLEQLVERGALDPDQASRLAEKALNTQKVVRLETPAPVPEVDNLVGEELAGVRLLQRLGGGGTGAVYLGRDASGGQFAVKVLDPRLARQPEMLNRFFREARALTMIDEPTLVSVFGAGRDRGLCYIVLEYVPSENLQELIKRKGPMRAREALRLCCHVARGLTAAHEHGVLHRDVKPQNILVLRDGSVKLADFGNAQIQDHASGVLVGSVRYMAPEQCRNDECTVRTDVYGLGCSLYFALTGNPPFDGQTPSEIVSAHMRGSPPPLRAPGRRFPRELEKVVMRCLQRRPDDRFPNVSAARRALQTVMTRLLGMGVV